MEEDKLKDKNEAEVKESPKETYFNRDTMEILTDSLDISYYKNLQQDEIVDSFLLGEFDSLGNYIINKDILLELVAVKKTIKESKENRYILSAKVKEGFDNFVFTLQIDDEGSQKIAALRLIENDTKPNGVKEILKTSIGRYKDDNDVYFMTKVKKIFNIVEGEAEGKDLNNEEFLKIVLKKLQIFKTLKKHEGEFEENAKNYIESVVAILKNNPGKFSEYVLRKYGIMLDDMKELIGKPKYYKTIKMKLDKLINESKKVIKDTAVNALIDEARKQFLDKCQNTKKAIFEVKVEAKKENKVKPVVKKQEAAEKKVEKKKSAPKKPEAKKAAKKPVKKQNNPAFKLAEQQKPKAPTIELPVENKTDENKTKAKVNTAINGATMYLTNEPNNSQLIPQVPSQATRNAERQNTL